MKQTIILLGLCLLAGALLAQQTNAVPLTKAEQKALNRIAMRNTRPQVKVAVPVVAPRTITLDKPEYLVPTSPVIVIPSAPPVEVATHPIPFQFCPSFDMSVISSLIDCPRLVFVAGTANLLPAYRQSLGVNKVLFTPQAIKKNAYEYRVMFREDVLEVYPMLLTRRAADQTYFGYLEFTISRALSEQNYELADSLAAQYQREWDRLKPTGTRIQRPR